MSTSLRLDVHRVRLPHVEQHPLRLEPKAERGTDQEVLLPLQELDVELAGSDGLLAGHALVLEGLRGAFLRADLRKKI